MVPEEQEETQDQERDAPATTDGIPDVMRVPEVEVQPATLMDVLGAEKVARVLAYATERGKPDLLERVTETDPVLAAVRLLQYAGWPVPRELKAALGEEPPPQRRRGKDKPVRAGG
jgi:hypothetical protein